jgi:hypothetical protein
VHQVRNPEYAAGYGHNGPYETVRVEDNSVGTIEHARAALAKLISDHGDELWLIDPRLVRRDGPNHPWETVEDPAKETIQRVFAEVARTGRRIGSGVVQGNDLYRIFSDALRQVGGDQNPEEFD